MPFPESTSEWMASENMADEPDTADAMNLTIATPILPAIAA